MWRLVGSAAIGADTFIAKVVEHHEHDVCGPGIGAGSQWKHNHQGTENRAEHFFDSAE
jgi:hypothetical protein